MERWRGTLMLGGLMVALAFAPVGEAADGRIVFSGTIEAATCTAGVAQITALRSPGSAHVSPQGRCTPVAAADGDGGPSFRLEVSDLQAGTSDPLLTYFAGYARGTGAATPRLVTQTYD